MAKQKAIGFGYIPEETKHHFLIRIERSKRSKIVIYERFVWDDSENQTTDIKEDIIKVKINYGKWDKVKEVVEKEFNRRLKQDNILVGKFKIGDTPIERLFGKELILLLWAIEDTDPSLIDNAINNWLGLLPEERWWLFTMANASTGHFSNKKGWRIAIRYALTDNPIDKISVQKNINDASYK